MVGIAVERCPSSNTITLYNPNIRSYYNPPYYRLNEALHTSSQFPQFATYFSNLGLVFSRQLDGGKFRLRRYL